MALSTDQLSTLGIPLPSGSITSDEIVRQLHLVSAGPCYGLVYPDTPARAVSFNGTVLQNDDNTFNYPSISVAQRTGTADQTVIDGFNAVSTPFSVGAPVVYSTTSPGSPHTPQTGVVRTVSSPNVSSVDIIFNFPNGLSKANLQTGATTETSVTFSLWRRLTGTSTWENVVKDQVIKDDAPSGYEVSFNIARPSGIGQFDWLAERTSADSTDQYTVDAFQVQFYNENQDVSLNYPYCGLVGLTFDAKSAPDYSPVTFHWKGMLCKVPSNYDPVARAYTGVWDGTLSATPQYTNNPIWIVYDLLTNSLYGIGRRIDADTIDLAEFYRTSQYNDELIDSGNGVMLPRFTFNTQITSQDDSFRVLQNLCGAFNAKMYMGSGLITVVQDRPISKWKLVTPDKIETSGFTYTSTEGPSRFTSVAMTFLDSANGGVQRTIVEPQAGDPIYGPYQAKEYVFTSMSAFGCTEEWRARHAARYVMDTCLFTTDSVSFSAALDYARVNPGDGLKIMDNDKAMANQASTVVSVVGTTITLDEAVEVSTGVVTIDVLLADGLTVGTKTVLNAAGTYTVLTVDSAFSQAVLAGAPVEVTGVVSPTYWVVYETDETDDGFYSVKALQYDGAKYDRFENGIQTAAPVYADTSSAEIPGAPWALICSPTGDTSTGAAKVGVLVDWQPPATGTVPTQYGVMWRLRGGSWNIAYTGVTEYEITGLAVGLYDIRVMAISRYGVLSAAASTTYQLDLSGGDVALSLFPVTNLQAVGGGTTWMGDALNIEWVNPTTNGAANPALKDFIVNIIDVTTGLTLRNVTIPAVAAGSKATYQYNYDSNLSDGGPRRTVKVTVQARDVYNNLTTNVVTVVGGGTIVSGTPNVSATFTADTTTQYANPERGWDGWGGDQFFNNFNSASLNSLRGSSDKITLAFAPLDLSAFITADLTTAFLNSLTAIAVLVRAAGVKVVLRPCYNYNSYSGNAPEASLAQIQRHIDQLAPWIAANKDIIAIAQAGFVGAYGEWHDSALSLVVASKNAIIDKLKASWPADLPIALRYPKDYINYIGSKKSTPGTPTSADIDARLWLHNDCFLEGGNDGGTYVPFNDTWSHSWTLAAQRTFAQAIALVTGMGGEVCTDGNGPPYSNSRMAFSDVTGEMPLYGFSYMNNGSSSGPEFLNAATATPPGAWHVNGAYPVIQRLIGYRLQLSGVNHTSTASSTSTYKAVVSTRNYGYAKFMQSRQLMVGLLDSTTNNIVAAGSAGDLTTLVANATSDTSMTAEFSVSGLALGTYSVVVYAPDRNASIAARKEYAVQFANANSGSQTWDSTHSRWNTGLTVTVVAGTPSVSYDPIVFSNPAPAQIVISATSGVANNTIHFTRPADTDFANFILWASPTNGFTVGSVTKVYSGPSDTYVHSGLADNATIYYKAAATDSFVLPTDYTGAGLNISSQISATTAAGASVNEYAIEGVVWKPNDPSVNNVSWTACTAVQTLGTGQGTSWAVAAGNAAWSSGILFLYYVPGTNVIQSTASLLTAVSGVIVASYRGGTSLQIGDGVAYIDGGFLLPQTVGANQVVTNGLITNSAQINNALITDAHFTGLLTAAKIDTRGITIEDGSGNVIFSASVPLNGAYIANASIGQAKFSGNLQSSTWNGAQGWFLDFNGNFLCANATVSGNVIANSVTAASVTVTGLAANSATAGYAAQAASGIGGISVTVLISSSDLPAGSSTVPCVIITGQSASGSAQSINIGVNQSSYASTGNIYSLSTGGGFVTKQVTANLPVGSNVVSSYITGFGPGVANGAMIFMDICVIVLKR